MHLAFSLGVHADERKIPRGHGVGQTTEYNAYVSYCGLHFIGSVGFAAPIRILCHQ